MAFVLKRLAANLATLSSPRSSYMLGADMSTSPPAYIPELNSNHTDLKNMHLIPTLSGIASAATMPAWPQSSDRERAQSMLAQQLSNAINNNNAIDCDMLMQKQGLSCIESDFLDEDELLSLIEEHQSAVRASTSHPDASASSALPSMSTETGATPMSSHMQNNDEDPGHILMYRSTNTKPPYKYAVLIGKAIATLQTSFDDASGVSLKDIYQWIEDNFMYYRRNKAGSQSWRSSVRHNLCCNSAFVKVQTTPGDRLAMDSHDSKAQASRWVIAPSHRHSFAPLAGSRLPHNRSPALNDMSAQPLPLSSPASAPVLPVTNSSNLTTPFGYIDSSFAAFASLLNNPATPEHSLSQPSTWMYNTPATAHPVTGVHSAPILSAHAFSDQTPRASDSFHHGIARAHSLYNLGALPDRNIRHLQAGPSSNGLTTGQDWISLYHNGGMNSMRGVDSMHSQPPPLTRSATAGGTSFLSQFENVIRSPQLQDPAQQHIQDTVAYANMLNLMN